MINKIIPLRYQTTYAYHFGYKKTFHVYIFKGLHSALPKQRIPKGWRFITGLVDVWSTSIDPNLPNSSFELNFLDKCINIRSKTALVSDVP